MHGGKRQGAGRPRGAANQRTRDIADKAVAEGITPLEVMLQDMRAKLGANDLSAAADRARDAAPYMHPKLSSVEADVEQHGTTIIEVVTGIPTQTG